MPTDTTEKQRFSDVIKRELDYQGSRDKVTILAAQNLLIGAVLGKVTAGAVPTTGTLTGTGNGTMSAVTGGINVQVGSYTIKNTKAVTHGGQFTVKDSNGKIIGFIEITAGAGGTAVFTSDEINFTITDGSTDFVLGDYFTVTVPAGGLQHRAVSFAAVDGSAKAVGILGPNDVNASASGEKTLVYTSGGTYEIQPGDTIVGGTSGATARVVAAPLTSGSWAGGDAAGTMTLDTVVGTFQSENLNVAANTNVATIAGDAAAVAAADKEGTAVVRNAEYVSSKLIWPSGATTAQKAAAKVQLAAFGIIEREEAYT